MANGNSANFDRLFCCNKLLLDLICPLFLSEGKKQKESETMVADLNTRLLFLTSPSGFRKMFCHLLSEKF
jgi:hypothetical protein